MVKKNSIEERQKKLDEFKVSLKKMNLEELTKTEEKIIEEADKVDKEVSKMSFNLPSDGYAEAATGIRYFLNTRKVAWQYTAAMITMYDFWNPEKKADKIDYPSLDSILRILGDMQFTGYTEWQHVVSINNYFMPLQSAYANATEKVYDVANRHSAVMDEIKLKDPNAANIPGAVHGVEK